MDSENELLETGDVENVFNSLPTMDEVNELLREDGATVSPSLTIGSPTAAVQAAIDAKIAEEMNSEIFQFDANMKTNANADAKTNADPLPLAPKPVPLFPNGLPPFRKPGESDGRSGAVPFKNKNNAKTYAAKASTPPRRREQVENIVFVYSTQVAKAPLSEGEWGLVDSFLIGKLAARDPNNPIIIRIANSGYDSAHRCGFIACRDLASENWCKTVIRMMGGGSPAIKSFRAWSKGEVPEIRLCRLFFPSRFDSLSEDQLIPLLKRHNPSLQQGTLTLKNCEDVQGGRAIFVELDPTAYAYTKSKNHRLEFLMMDIDCQIYIPPVKKAPSSQQVPGISKILQAPPNPVRLPSAVADAGPSHASSLDPRLNRSKSSNSGNSLAKGSSDSSGVTAPANGNETKKRERNSAPGTDASKKREIATTDPANKPKNKN